MSNSDDLLNTEPWYRPTIRKIEGLIKRSTFGLIGRLMRTPHLDSPVPLEKISRLLILRYDALGDLVLSTPIWRTLKRLKPDLIIGVAGSKRNIDLLRSDIDIDYYYELGPETNRSVWRETLRARAIGWDMIANLVYKDKTRGSIIAWLIDPKAIRVTSVREPPELYRKIYTIVGKRPPLHPPTPMLEQALATVRAGIDFNHSDDDKLPSLLLDPNIERTVKDEMRQLFVKSGTTNIVLLNTNSADAFREWGLENSWELSNSVVTNYPDVLVIWTAAPHRTEEVTAFLAANHHPRIVFVSTETAQHISALVRQSDLVISPDTSIIHIASAESKPIVGLYMEENEFLPITQPNIVLKPRIGQPLRSIPVRDVFEAVRQILPLQTSKPYNAMQTGETDFVAPTKRL